MAENNQIENSSVDSPSEMLHNASSLQVDYSLEEERRKSFATWPAHNPVDPARLAKAGFYYSGKEDRVICFSCLGNIKDWNYGDIVQKKHSDLFPNCDFVNGRSKNVPITETRGQNLSIHCNVNQKPPTSLSYTQIREIMNDVDYDKMKSKVLRLKSFDDGWPLSDMNIVRLAEAGFFYLGIGDNVQCAFCKGVLNDWDCDDNPFVVHQKYFPFCPYVLEETNVPSEKKLFQSKPASKWFQANSEDVCGNRHVNPDVVQVFDSNRFSDEHKVADRGQIHKSLVTLGVQPYQSPLYPEQASFNARMRSFESWPSTVDVPAKYLAEAGFFYTGFADHTKCFHCGGGLCHWEESDDPWCEHAKWFCNCPYLRLHKDDEFIRKVHSKNRNRPAGRYPHEELMTNLEEAMQTPIVRRCLQYDLYPRYIIRAAVLRHMKEHGTMFYDMEELHLAITALKQEMEFRPLECCNGAGLAVNNINLRQSVSPSDGDSSVADKLFHTSGPEKDEIVKSEPTGDQCLCKICMDKDVGIVFLPCGHLLACNECASSLYLCPLCRRAIKATVKVYLP